MYILDVQIVNAYQLVKNVMVNLIVQIRVMKKNVLLI